MSEVSQGYILSEVGSVHFMYGVRWEASAACYEIKHCAAGV